MQTTRLKRKRKKLASSALNIQGATTILQIGDSYLETSRSRMATLYRIIRTCTASLRLWILLGSHKDTTDFFLMK
jgi:hypothetical protein